MNQKGSRPEMTEAEFAPFVKDIISEIDLRTIELRGKHPLHPETPMMMTSMVLALTTAMYYVKMLQEDYPEEVCMAVQSWLMTTGFRIGMKKLPPLSNSSATSPTKASPAIAGAPASPAS